MELKNTEDQLVFTMGSATSTPTVVMPVVAFVPPFVVEGILLEKLWKEVYGEVAYCAWEFRTLLEARQDLDSYSKVVARDACMRLVLEEMIKNQSCRVDQLRDFFGPRLNPSEDLKFQFRWESDKLTCFRILNEWAHTL